MYRQPATRDAIEAPPTELILEGGDRRRAPAIAVFQMFGLPAMVAAFLSVAVDPAVGLVGLIATAGFLIWRWRRPASVVALRVHGGLVEVSLPAPKRTVRIALADLSDVVLDTKTIRPVSDGGSMIPAVRFIDSNVGPELDTARVVLVRDDDADPVPLTAAHLAHMIASDWLSKTRVFLRKNGWVPEDEREA